MKKIKEKLKNNYFFGLYCEYLTVIIYALKGYVPFKHRYKNPFRELDCIFIKNNTIIIVEVKARRKKSDITLEIISPKAIEEIKMAARHFCSNKKFKNYQIQIDLVIFNSIFKLPQISQNITA